ncbi:MAG: hypothetical protein P1P64_02400 [Treponemataceae bacterium]
MKKLFLTFLIVFRLVSLQAEPLLNVFKISGEAVDEKTISNINDAVFAFLSESKDYKIVDCRTFSSPSSENLPPADFYFYGSLINDKDELKLDLILKSTVSGTTRLLSKNYTNANLILLESKSLLAQLLDLNYVLPAAKNTSSSATSVSEGFAGTWEGEEDVRSIKLLQNGRGVIVFTTGFSISVDYTEKNGKLTVTQKGNITERQFPNIPAELAKELIKQAKPIVWDFESNGTRLDGSRTETTAEVKNGTLVNIKSETKSVTWSKVQ